MSVRASRLLADLSREQLSRRAIAVVDGREVLGDLFRRHVISAIGEVESKAEKRWALYFQESYSFLVAMMAVLYCRSEVTILPSVRPEFLAAISGEIDVLMTDHEVDAPVAVRHCDFVLGEATGYAFESLRPDVKIRLFTSGTTGEPRIILKDMRHLECEVEMLEQMFGKEMGDADIVSTVSHQHIYGLLFRVLWPLASGRRFSARLCKSIDEVVGEAPRRSVLVSSPAFLKRWPDRASTRELGARLQMTFSSGGLLDTNSAVRLHDDFGLRVVEVFGSSETGGVAFRSQTQNREETPWTLLDGVKALSEPPGHQLLVKSPFTGVSGWQKMGDRAVMLDSGQFMLKGRADRIVKVEERRLSLPELESRLLLSELVDECRAELVSGSTRQVIGMVAVLSSAGEGVLKESKRQLNLRLRRYLEGYFEPTQIPKKWRYVDELPLDTQGKITRSEMMRLFDE